MGELKIFMLACFKIKKAKLGYHLFETPLNTLPDT
jgi:hypothetical protein